MKYITLGIKDWCKDMWHDWLLIRLVSTFANKNLEEGWLWKEGSVWHYIRQRKIANNKI